MDHFEFAKHICRCVAEFDYHNYVWHIDGDQQILGEYLRVMHPLYPDVCLTSSVTPEVSRTIREVFARAARTKSVEEFIGILVH